MEIWHKIFDSLHFLISNKSKSYLFKIFIKLYSYRLVVLKIPSVLKWGWSMASEKPFFYLTFNIWSNISIQTIFWVEYFWDNFERSRTSWQWLISRCSRFVCNKLVIEFRTSDPFWKSGTDFLAWFDWIADTLNFSGMKVIH